jgi:hypothetical protein
MNQDLNQFFVFFLCLIRCLVPAVILLGLSYLLRRWGWLPTEPEEEDEVPTPSSTK